MVIEWIWTWRRKPKISFPLFRLSAEGWGEEPSKEMQGNFWVCPRESASAVEARLGDRSVRFGFKPPRTRRVRSQGLRPSKKVRAKCMISSQFRTSSGLSAAEPRREAAREWAAADCALRARANSEGGQDARNEIGNGTCRF